jgi:predicted nucleotidyltransferase
MKLEHYPIEKLKSEILMIVGKYLDLNEYKLFFFGSRVNDNGNERSDIDVGIYGPCEVPYEIMFKIKEELNELPILYKIDFVDFSKVSDDFKKIALSKIEIINDKI